MSQLAHDFGGALQALFRRFPLLEEHHLHVGTYACCLAMAADEADETIWLRKAVIAKTDHHALRAGLDLLDIAAAAIALDRRDLEQIAHLVRHRAKPVAQFS